MTEKKGPGGLCTCGHPRPTHATGRGRCFGKGCFCQQYNSRKAKP